MEGRGGPHTSIRKFAVGPQLKGFLMLNAIGKTAGDRYGVGEGADKISSVFTLKYKLNFDITK